MSELWQLLPKDQCERVFASDLCDIDPEFLGFTEIYQHVAAIIPRDFTVVDLGCALRRLSCSRTTKPTSELTC